MLSRRTMFMTVLALLGLATSLQQPIEVQAGGGGARCMAPGCNVIEVDVEIDIKPGEDEDEDPPSINPNNHGKLVVALLSSPTFDASRVNIGTVVFGPLLATPVHWALRDINKDGFGDLLLKFRTRETGIQCGDTAAELLGNTFQIPLSDGTFLVKSFSGIDTFRTVGCHRK